MSNATVRVQFGAGINAGDHLSAEVDDRVGGPNNGKTSFLAGDTAWFLVFRSAGIELELDSSAGSFEGGSEVTLVRTESVSFENSKTATLPAPASSLGTVVWVGRSLGGLTLSDDGMTMTAPTAGVAIARVTYVAKAVSFGLKSPAQINGEVDFDVLILIKGSRPAGESNAD